MTCQHKVFCPDVLLMVILLVFVVPTRQEMFICLMVIRRSILIIGYSLRLAIHLEKRVALGSEYR